MTSTPAKFPLGQTVMTATVQSCMTDEMFAAFAMVCLRRHQLGQGGDLDNHDSKANDRAVRLGDARILSAYTLPYEMRQRIEARDQKLWIITEADRSSTTILWPSDY